MNPPRKIELTYEDPLDLVWISTAKRIGWQVQRDSDTFASWDGNGTLRIGTAETLDSDDCLAQMIFHEICHALVQGPQSLNQPDWGLENDVPEHIVFEQACLRLQAKLAGQFGLRLFLATTTDFRDYYDQLEADPISNTLDLQVPDNSNVNESVQLAAAGWSRATSGPWSTPLRIALETTQAIVQLIQPFALDDSIWQADKPRKAAD